MTRTYHVVPPDVALHGVVGILRPAGASVPQPGLAGQHLQPVQEDARVEDEPPAALAELGDGGGHAGPSLVPEPSLHLQQSPRHPSASASTTDLYL